MKILAITSIRSEYDLLSPLFYQIESEPELELKLLVGGAHNSPGFGYSVKDIRADGFSILAEIESLLDADTRSARLKSAAILLLSAIDIVKSYAPDLIIYAGDREEVMIGALLGGYLAIPTLHFYGGDHAADGHIDNPVRHAVSKLSTFHFVSCEQHLQRLLAIGETEGRIFNIGSIALDKFNMSPVIPDIAQKIAGNAIIKPYCIFIYHPVEEEIAHLEEIITASINTILTAGFHCFIGLPNIDHGNTIIRNVYNKLALNNTDITLYGNLSRNDFISLFKSAQIIVGNSSAGLLEAASIPIAAINIGKRQRGRMSGDNVIFCDASEQSIKNALDKAVSAQFQSVVSNVKNPYGEGHSAAKAMQLIKSLNFIQWLPKKEDALQ